jgi:hypothetical protein
MLVMTLNNIKYWVLVSASILKILTPAMLLFAACFTKDATARDVFFVVGVCSLGWTYDVKLPKKS